MTGIADEAQRGLAATHHRSSNRMGVAACARPGENRRRSRDAITRDRDALDQVLPDVLHRDLELHGGDLPVREPSVGLGAPVVAVAELALRFVGLAFRLVGDPLRSGGLGREPVPLGGVLAGSSSSARSRAFFRLDRTRSDSACSRVLPASFRAASSVARRSCSCRAMRAASSRAFCSSARRLRSSCTLRSASSRSRAARSAASALLAEPSRASSSRLHVANCSPRGGIPARAVGGKPWVVRYLRKQHVQQRDRFDVVAQAGKRARVVAPALDRIGNRRLPQLFRRAAPPRTSPS